ncbi:MAG: FtsL-like putative cell division protein [Saprospiraceae bacterium]
MALPNFKNLFNVSGHATNIVFGNLSFLLFLGFLGIIYIANAHFAEKRVRDIQRLQKEIKELKWEYMSIKSNLMFRSMQSQIDTSVENSGLDLYDSGPKVIEIK